MENNKKKKIIIAASALVVAVTVAVIILIIFSRNGSHGTGDSVYDLNLKPEIVDVIAAGGGHTLAIKSDNTVIANEYANEDTFFYRDEGEVDDWTDIIDVSAGSQHSVAHTVGLKSDGTVVAVGSNDYGQCNVMEWGNIKLP